ncbi:ATP-binding protein [uncultured Thiodictyon sp.]|uniref:HD domain-containing protein n=1 Tax=uncultured Thiodictyon sp. TaxID=1846217 RepID=UPI0025D43E51|nr:ATP-binding protein [uncultured Thiodictyon sp.]
MDALWETASLIAGDEFELSPAEGYVLGGAILLHDAAMTLAAFPGGLTDLAKTDEWRDAIALILGGRQDEPVAVDDIENAADDVIAEAVPIVLRALHAKQAEQLPITAWPGPDQPATPEFLIQDSDLRGYYGRLIGKTAASHWWNVADLSALPPVCNAGPGLPASWRVDPQKIACLLRVADAAHIDHRRAPRWLRTLMRPAGESAKHWAFQQRLGKPSRESDALVYTGSEFPVHESDAWWLCFDTIQMIDQELRGVDAFLEETGRPRFKADHVKAAESPARLARYIETPGWRPVDTRLRVTDVAALVERLGGKRLYGDDPRVALRELIQNAADAIRARRCVPGIGADYGVITVTLRDRSDGVWLEVQDNGVGMSTSVLTGTLLDFGASLWRSSAMQQEHPGLVGRGLNASGRFGIGFFSIFILGEHVKVTSRRYAAALVDTRTLEFRHGLASRPVLRDSTPDESLVECGTRVAVRLLKDPDEKGGLLGRVNQARLGLRALAASLCPALDVRIDVADRSEIASCAVEANDWRTVSGDQLLIRALIGSLPLVIRPSLGCAGNLRELRGELTHGRACIHANQGDLLAPAIGIVTIGGLRAAALSYIGGVLIGGEPETVARNTAFPTAPLPVLGGWATEQAQLLSVSDLAPWSKVRCACVVLALGGEPGDLPIALVGNEGKSQSQLRGILQHRNTVRVLKGLIVEYDEERDEMYRSNFKTGFLPDPDLLFLEADDPMILAVGNKQWPKSLPGYASLPGPRTPFDAFCALVSEVWGEDFMEYEEERPVGLVDNYSEIMREVVVFERPLGI